MLVYLVRHGQAKSKNADPERHLTHEGMRDVRKIADSLKERGVRVSSIWHSGKTRAAETAHILASAVATDQTAIRHDGLAPDDDISLVEQELLRARHDVMIVSHLPFLPTLVSALLIGKKSPERSAFQPGGTVCLERDASGKGWRTCWTLVP